MKISRLPFLLVIVSLCYCLSCNDDEDPNPNQDAEIIEGEPDDVPVDQGSIGILIDTRAIARKGYEPALVEITVPNATFLSGSYEVNTSTNIASIAVLNEDLTEEVKDLLGSGVSVTIEVKSEGGETLAEVEDTFTFLSGPEPYAVDTQLPQIFPEPNLREDVPYFFQVLDDSKIGHQQLLRLHIDRNFEPNVDPFVLDVFNEGLRPFYEFYFEETGDGFYYIKYLDPNDDTFYYMRMSNPGFLYNFYLSDNTLLTEEYKFDLIRDEQGLLQIVPASGEQIPLDEFDVTDQPFQPYTLLTRGSSENYLPFRMVAANVDWAIEDRGTEFNPPILPPARLDFAFSSTLRNCSPATLTESVGRSETRTTSYTVGTEESLELFSSQEVSTGVTAGVETEANFFGQKASASLEVSTDFTYSTSSTTTSTNTWEESVEESVEVSRVRDVEIPPFTAVQVYDAIQSIDEVEIPFVQTLRIRGDVDGAAMSGEELRSQMLANQFGGVVSRVDSEFIEVTIRGRVQVDSFFEVESSVEEIEGACD